ncbi:sensor histidine kinase [Roseivivax isoporae]|uniref:histidine kinase n=1 Tax=Roseivivax isoporae LMG 25204 TaxID=1449351 RepID=X7FC80_9RHOB|nr:sensor histidine kinase [Roseivivax isoporae]ETX30353.1 hypothetical protein RISW2_16080 [Roseivivax isoporae LMG 25204]
MNARRVPSLRTRLFATILSALLVTAIFASAVRLSIAREMSMRLYDNTLEVVALTISRDTILTDGDMLAEQLLDRLVQSLGDPVYYRIIGPGGRFVTGYSRGPDGSPARGTELPTGEAVFYDGTYFGDPVRGVVLREFVADTELQGWTTVEVWQTVTQRHHLAVRLLSQTLMILAGVMAVVAAALAVGIWYGLGPLHALSEAVSRRSPRDLAPISGPVPRELDALVAALNGLIAEMREAIDKRDAFISDAAHQLRNPIAAVAAQLDAGIVATTDADRREILAEAHRAMARVRRMTTQLLSLEALDGAARMSTRTADLARLAAEAAAGAAPRILAAGGDIDFDAPEDGLAVTERNGLLTELIDNLLDNACNYGLRRGGRISIQLAKVGGSARLAVTDDGPGVPEEERARIFERFHRGTEDGNRGSGLGLAIARRIAATHDGTLELEPSATGARFVVVLPLAA